MNDRKTHRAKGHDAMARIQVRRARAELRRALVHLEDAEKEELAWAREREETIDIDVADAAAVRDALAHLDEIEAAPKRG